MKITRTNPFLSLVNEYLIDSPAPNNINYFWNFGSLLGLNQVLLIITGVTLAKHYSPTIELAFSSSEHIVRDVNSGWLIRYQHANTVSTFFIFCYIHKGRGLYYGSYRAPRSQLWIVGVLIFIIKKATAFIGYVLIWGQKSKWGAIVITNLFSAVPFVGHDQVEFIWGGMSVDQPTLNRFFSQHFLLPFILAAAVCLHQMALHTTASNNPTGISSTTDRIRFFPYFIIKDLITIFWFILLVSAFVFFAPHMLGDAENSVPANALITPAQIVPEWYFQPFYCIQRSIPNKLLGVIAKFSALIILIPLSLIQTLNIRSNRYRPLLQILFWIFVFNFLFLLWLGQKAIAQPYTLLGQIATGFYFLYFIIQMIQG